MKSPINGEEMELVIKPTIFTYKGKEILIDYNFYFCKESNESYTDENLDNINFTQVVSSYLKKYPAN